MVKSFKKKSKPMCSRAIRADNLNAWSQKSDTEHRCEKYKRKKLVTGISSPIPDQKDQEAYEVSRGDRPIKIISLNCRGKVPVFDNKSILKK